MSFLDNIQKGKNTKPRRTLLYGLDGIGKSTWAAMAPKPIFIDTEGSLDDIDCEKFPKAKTFEEVILAISDLYTNKEHDYKTLCVDSVDWLERLVWEKVCADEGVANIEEIGYAKGYTIALNPWQTFIDGLDALRASRQMSIILVAHYTIEKIKEPDKEAYDVYGPRLHKKSAPIIREWCDEVFFARYKIQTMEKDEGFGRKRHQAVGDGERVIHTSPNPSYMAKNRLHNLPEVLPMDYREYAKFFNNKGSPPNPPSTPPINLIKESETKPKNS